MKQSKLFAGLAMAAMASTVACSKNKAADAKPAVSAQSVTADGKCPEAGQYKSSEEGSDESRMLSIIGMGSQPRGLLLTISKGDQVVEEYQYALNGQKSGLDAAKKTNYIASCNAGKVHVSVLDVNGKEVRTEEISFGDNVATEKRTEGSTKSFQYRSISSSGRPHDNCAQSGCAPAAPAAEAAPAPAAEAAPAPATEAAPAPETGK